MKISRRTAKVIERALEENPKATHFVVDMDFNWRALPFSKVGRIAPFNPSSFNTGRDMVVLRELLEMLLEHVSII